MKLLLVFFVSILPLTAMGKAYLFRGTGSLVSHGGFATSAPKQFLAQVVANINDSDEFITGLGYLLEFSDGSQEKLALLPQQVGDSPDKHSRVLFRSGSLYQSEFSGVSGTWDVKIEEGELDLVEVEVQFVDEDGSTMNMTVKFREENKILVDSFTCGHCYNDLLVPDASMSMAIIEKPSRGSRDYPTYELFLSSQLDLNTLRGSDIQAEKLAEELFLPFR